MQLVVNENQNNLDERIIENNSREVIEVQNVTNSNENKKQEISFSAMLYDPNLSYLKVNVQQPRK